MVLVNAENISKNYTEKPLLKDISLSISENEKTGLIGVNGTGKSTLLRILAGKEAPDSGKLTYTNGITIAWLPQNPPYDAQLTVSEQAEQYLRQINETTPDYQCRALMTKLGISDFDKEGMLVEDFDRMGSTITIYNPPYYPEHMVRLGFEKEVDWVERKVMVPTTEAQADAHYILLPNGTRQYFQAGDMRFLDQSSVVGGSSQSEASQEPSTLADAGLIDEHDMTIIGDPNPDVYG